MSFFKKRKKIIDKIEEYLSYIDNCRDRFESCMNVFLNEGNKPDHEKMVQELHKSESQADDLKREIEFVLYQKNLIPSSRGDVLGLIETLDKIPNILESICFQIYLQNIIFPEEYKNDILDLVRINIESYNHLKIATIGLFYNKNVLDKIKEIDMKESESDKIERKLIKEIFNSNMEKIEKLLLKETIVKISDISDRVQSVADRLNLAIIKRKL